MATGTDQLSLDKVIEATGKVCSDWYSLAIQLEISYKIRKVCITNYSNCLKKIDLAISLVAEN